MSEANLDKVEKAADRIREELFATLRELDRRRIEVTDWRKQLLDHRTLLMVAGGAIGAGLLGLAGVMVARYQHRDQRRRKAVKRGLRRAWDHPERLAVQKKTERPLPQELGRKVALVVFTTLATQLARQAGQKFIYQKPQPG